MEEATQVVVGCKSDLESIRVTWKNAEEIESAFQRFHDILWPEVQAEQIGKETKARQESTRQLDRAIRWCDVKNMLLALDLHRDLCHPSMRARHWAELMKVMGNKFNLSLIHI